jgi:hypothetical protein
MKLEKLRHHVLEGMRSFVIFHPTAFQQGFIALLSASCDSYIR